jgi:hypothetical protein
MKPTSPLPYTNVITTLHLIGPDESKKQEFVKKKLSQYTCFDVIMYFTQLTSTLPQETFDNPKKLEEYWQSTTSALYHVLESTIRLGHIIAVVSSPGNLPFINQFLENYRPYRIWIEEESPTQPRFTEKVSIEYLKQIYTQLETLWQTNQIPYENKYTVNTNQFLHPFPPPLFQRLNLGTCIPEPNLFLYRTTTKQFKCSKCEAEFSKPEFLRLHWRRSPSCQSDLV